MTHAAYVFAGYAATTLVLAGYAGWIISRRRALLRQVNRVGDPAQPAASSDAGPEQR